MIWAEFKFDSGVIRQILRQFFSLPDTLRPTHHSLGEDERGQYIADPTAFIEAVNDDQRPGPYLTNRHCSYSIDLSEQNITCLCEIDVEPGLAKQFLLHMAAARPKFAYACMFEELRHRNRTKIELGVNSIESWVGCDIRKNIPGFYWLTLLSEDLAQKHGVSLSAVEEVALEHIRLEGDQHLFRFYDHPEDWKNTDRVAHLCSLLPGVFDIGKINSLLTTVKTYAEYDALISKWR